MIVDGFLSMVVKHKSEIVPFYSSFLLCNLELLTFLCFLYEIFIYFLIPLQCIFYDPKRTDALLKRGQFYFANKNWISAIHDFTTLLNIDQQNSEAW